MPREIKAHLFWVHPVDHPAHGVVRCIEDYFKGKADPLELSHNNENLLATELQWHTNREILTGSIMKLRDTSLPVAVQGTKTKALPLSADEQLGEPMCFAYWPDPGAALIHYSHNGCRHPVLKTLISRLKYAEAITIEPLLKLDMLAQLEAKSYFRAIEFGLTDPQHVAELRNQGGAVGHAVKIGRELGGVNIRVEVTMGHSRGEGLPKDLVNSIARGLASIARDAPEGIEPVTTVKVRGSDGEDAPCEELDLLAAREIVTLTVDERGRHLDRLDCQRKLCEKLHEHKTAFRRQLKKP